MLQLPAFSPGNVWQIGFSWQIGFMIVGNLVGVMGVSGSSWALGCCFFHFHRCALRLCGEGRGMTDWSSYTAKQASSFYALLQTRLNAPLQGFLPSGRTRTGADRTLLLLCCALLVVQLAALATFFVYGVLAYNAGRDLSKQLESSHPEVKQQLVSMTDSANTLQSVVNGTRLIAGRSMSSTFEPSPPDLATPSQVGMLLCFIVFSLLGLLQIICTIADIIGRS